MRKLFGVITVIAILLAFTSLLLGSREQPSDVPPSYSPSVHSPQESYGEARQPIESNAPAPLPNTQDTDILLVNAWNPLPDDFIAGELLTLFNYKDRQFGLAGSDIRLDKAVYEAADAMFAAARKDGVESFILASGYRSREKQTELFDGRTDGTAARPGHSEHETGLAFDVTVIESENGFDTTPQFEWLSQNCWDYGFILRYPKGKEDITGIPYEPWHYRYVGLPHSQAIRDQKLTLEEYLEKS